jgi:hypothetical protein
MWSNKAGVWHCCYPDNCPLSDLNAMHEAEKCLNTVHLYETYAMNLCMPMAEAYPDHRFIACMSTAPQRAEALLRTIGKWVEE